ncbi:MULTISPECIES: XRE family transcriptional regulator [unclassified Pseudovibrio]|uniref:helix-turn-helix domain-containing protein n=1 Tax=unclassified Pseudovibrio TaxID=2627060 RepID=UPI0007AEB915|nr:MULTISPECIES: XRE family transcriptional regulator [unclassified Pseudovibrio]KZK94720.1 helix-turn-helix protein [Pseudovibrio sp. W74]KZL04720.1 helix-turn-helix protein [Pseudovibrio sp. Ad14]
MNDKCHFYGEKLRLARLLHGLTQQELGEKACVSRQFIHQLESDVREPATDVLNVLREVLAVEKAFFSSPLTNEVRVEQCHFRKRKTTPVGVANRVAAYGSIFEQLVEIIHSFLELPAANFPNPDNPKDCYSNQEIEQYAFECRNLWGLGRGPIPNLTRVLENAGVIITHFGGVSDKVDALSLSRKFPIIVRNDAKESVCRMRFDLAHECGHFVLHEGVVTGDNVTESEADRFASELLFPRAAFISEFPDLKGRRLNWSLIYKLKVRWGVSARAILYKAHQNDLISAQQFRGGNVWLNKSGQTKVERYDDNVRSETPELLPDALEMLQRELGITPSAIASKLRVSLEILEMIISIKFETQSTESNVVPFFNAK